MFAIAAVIPAAVTVDPVAATHETLNMRGTMVVTGSSGGASTSIGGDTVTDTFCSGYPTAGATAATSGGSIVISWAPTVASSGCPTTTPKNLTYFVIFNNGPCWTITYGQYSKNQNCSGTSYITIGSLRVTGNRGGGTYSLPSNLTPTDNAMVWVGSDYNNQGYSYNMYVPLTIVGP